MEQQKMEEQRLRERMIGRKEENDCLIDQNLALKGKIAEMELAIENLRREKGNLQSENENLTRRLAQTTKESRRLQNPFAFAVSAVPAYRVPAPASSSSVKKRKSQTHREEGEEGEEGAGPTDC